MTRFEFHHACEFVLCATAAGAVSDVNMNEAVVTVDFVVAAGVAVEEGAVGAGVD